LSKTPKGEVVIYTDGGCSPNPGLGAWAAVLMYGEHKREISGGEPETTNNRMELMAAVRALETLRRDCPVILHTDSQYLQKGMTTWLANWKRNNWKRRKGSGQSGVVKNADLWKRLDDLAQQHRVQWRWVRGHAGNMLNERCDELVTIEIDRLRCSSPS
jgi:ribonuclease HI